MSPTPVSTFTWSDITDVSHEKAWEVLRRLDREQLLVLFARALRFVPASCLEEVFRDHAHPHEVGEIEQVKRQPLVESAREFVENALDGAFYEDFRVNSHNCTDKSGGTQTFEAKLDLLFDRCVEDAARSDPAEIVAVYELLLGLLREIDKFEKDIVFFADEGGVWQFNMNWKRILPPYIKCLAKVTEQRKFERRAKAVIEEFVDPWQRSEIQRELASYRE